ncbi:MAG TPA: FG-GAP-like repeat-containing protein, partial [Acidimicrobiia bacterium]|nr:FG-GAP-like repeat-containing protein [Acidimicrobiia bacterium]
GLVLDGEGAQDAVSGHVEIAAIANVQSGELQYASFGGSGHSIFFTAPTGQNLALGVYENAKPLETATTAGLYLSTPVHDPDCGGVGGRFVIEELGVDAGGHINQFFARFQVECGLLGGTVFGEVALNASKPPSGHRVFPRSVAFGTLKQYSVAPVKTVALRNASTAPMPVGVLQTAAPFSIVSDECSGVTLAPDEVCEVRVTVSTLTLGSRTRSLRIPNSFTTIDGTGVFDVVLSVSTVEDPLRFTEQQLRIPGRLLPLVGDWDGDEVDHDILWYAPGIAGDSYWFADGDRTWTKRTISVSGHYEPIVGYFDDDAVTDVLWFAPGPDTDWLWLGKPGGGVASSRALRIDSEAYAFPGDFNGDGLDDILWYGPGSVPDSLWLSRGDGRFTWKSATINGFYNGVFMWDHDGNGRSDVLFWRFATERHPVWTASPGGVIAGTFAWAEARGIPGAYPIPGRFNDDDRTDIFWYGPSVTTDELVLSGVGRVAYSMRGDLAPMAGNFSGDDTELHDILWWNTRPSPDHYWSGDTGKLRAKTYENTHMAFDPTLPTLGYFDSLSDNNALDILWYGEGAAPDRMFWAKDVDGSSPGAASRAAAPVRGRELLRRALWNR